MDPRELYLTFLKDLKILIEQNVPKAPRLASLLHHVGIRGLGMTLQQLHIRKPLKGGTRWKVDPFDENAIEAALQIKDENGAEGTVLSIGEKGSPSILRKALAVGADNLILVQDQNFEDLESYSTAYVLANAIRRIGDYDLILTGRQAGDWDSGQVGLILAEMLGIVAVNLARGIKIEDGKLVVKKIMPGGFQLINAEMPALVTVSNEVGELRYPSMKNIMLSRRQPIDVWDAEGIDTDLEELKKMEILELLQPPDIRRQCQIIEGGSEEEKGEKLAITLKRAVLNS